MYAKNLFFCFSIMTSIISVWSITTEKNKSKKPVKNYGRIDDSDGQNRNVFDKIMELNNYVIREFSGVYERLNYQEENKRIVKKLYDTYLYPDSDILIADFIKNKNMPDYFADNIRGRMNPLNEIAGMANVVEYIYGIFVNAGFQFSKVEYIDLIAENNKVFFRVDALFTIPAISNSTFNITKAGRFTFNQNSQIESFDINILNIGKLLDTLHDHKSRDKLICSVHEQHCTGENQQYANSYDCSDFLIGITEGTWNMAKSNTVVCRQLHSYMAIMNPDYHCSHLGPAGGGICVDWPYETYYKKYF
jgi:hypothetical protein